MTSPKVAAIVALALIAITQTSAAPAPPYTISSKTTADTRPLRDDGSVDYISLINERGSNGVTPDNNGFVTLLRIVGTNAVPGSVRDQLLVMCSADELPADTGWKEYTDPFVDSGKALRPWTENQDPAYAKFLKDHEAFLTLAQQASQKPHWWCPAVAPDGSLAGSFLPDLNWLRQVSQQLCQRSLLRAKQGDFDGFLADIIAAKRLARHAGGWTVVGHIIEYGIDRQVNESIGAVAGSGMLSSRQCIQLAATLDQVQPVDPVWNAIEPGERWCQLDIIALIAQGNVPADFDMSIFKTVNRNAVDWNEVLKRANQINDELVRILKIESATDAEAPRKAFAQKMKPIFARRATHTPRGTLAINPGESPQQYTQRIGDAILGQFTPSVIPVDNRYRAAAIREKLTRIILAAAQYRADNGKWPDQLQLLSPRYLHESVEDPYSTDGRQPCRCIKTDSSAEVYSVGPNHIDDGGLSSHNSDDIAIGATNP